MEKTLMYATIAVVLVASGSSSAVVIDPDAFPAGTVLNTAYAGVTLTTLGDPDVLLSSDVVVRESSYASTGSNVFGNNDINSGISDTWGNGSYEYLRVDFTMGAAMVSLDFITNDEWGDNNAVLRAYDESGAQVDIDGPYNVPSPAGTYHTLMVSAPYIAWVVAEWDEIDKIENGMLDHLEYSPVPEPITLCLLGLGGVMLRKRNILRSLNAFTELQN